MSDTKESGLAYEIRLLEARLTKKHNKAIKALENRILGLEGTLARVGDWVARKVEQEAREKAEKEASPVIHVRDEGGEVWISKKNSLTTVDKTRLVDAISDKRL